MFTQFRLRTSITRILLGFPDYTRPEDKEGKRVRQDRDDRWTDKDLTWSVGTWCPRNVKERTDGPCVRESVGVTSKGVT